MKRNEKTTGLTMSMVLRVNVSTGETKEHIYSLPSEVDEAVKFVTGFAKHVATELMKPTGVIQLINPSIAYTAKHIVYIEPIFRGPADWQEMMKKSMKPPLGFRPQESSK